MKKEIGIDGSFLLECFLLCSAALFLWLFWSGVVVSGGTVLFNQNKWSFWVLFFAIFLAFMKRNKPILLRFSWGSLLTVFFISFGVVFSSCNISESWVYAGGALAVLFFYFSLFKWRFLTLSSWMLSASIVYLSCRLLFNEYWGHWLRLGNGINPNMFGLYSAFTFIFLATVSCSLNAGLITRRFSAIGAFSSIICVMMSMSRAASFSVVASVVFLWWMYRRLSRETFFIIVAYALFSLVAFSGGIFLSRGNELVKDFQATVAQSPNPQNPRVELWRAAIRIISENPIEGVGENGWRPALKSLNERGMHPDYALNFDHAHNELLNTGAKFGLPAAILYLALLLYPIMKGFILWRRGGDSLLSLQLFCALSMLIFGSFEVIFHHGGYIRVNAVICLLPILVSEIFELENVEGRGPFLHK